MVPPWLSTIPRHSESPRPVPWPGGFVVKKGSKIRPWISGGMPAPGSATVKTMRGGAGAGGGPREGGGGAVRVRAPREDEAARRRARAHRVVRVGREVHDELLELVRIGPQQRQVGGEVDHHLHGVEAELVGEQLGRAS